MSELILHNMPELFSNLHGQRYAEQLNNSRKELLFADDQSRIFEDEEQLHYHINTLVAACRKYNVKVNMQKNRSYESTKPT